MEKVRILNIIGKRPTGGIGSFVYNYQSHFTDDHLQVDYLLFDDTQNGPFDEKVKALGSTVYVLPALKNTRLISIWKKIDQFMKTIGCNYTAIHLHSVNIAFMCFPSAKKYGVKNLISHSHATVYSDKPINAIRNKFLCKNLLKQATVYMACSKAAGQFLYGKNNMDRVLVFNNAIECEKFKFSSCVREEIRRQSGWSEKYVIGHVGRFCEQKNQLFLIDIFKECHDKNSSSILVLVGDGPQIQLAKEKVRDLGLTECVYFMGQRNDVNKLLQGMDVFALPSLFEGLPVIGIEAQASGLPMVVSDTVTEELDITGIEFLSLSDSIEKWASVILGVGLRENRENCFRIVSDKGYEIQKEALRLQEFYLDLER